jgi:ketosteroid isomerase-like protein
MSEENVAVVRQAIEAFRDRDAPALVELCDPNIEFRSAFAAAGGRTYRGHEDVPRYLDDIDATFEDWHSEDEQTIDAGTDRVVLIYRIVGEARGSGIPIDQRIAILWTLRDGKLLLGVVYLQPDDALEAAGLSE